MEISSKINFSANVPDATIVSLVISIRMFSKELLELKIKKSINELFLIRICRHLKLTIKLKIIIN